MKTTLNTIQSDIVMRLTRTYALFRNATATNNWYSAWKYGQMVESQCQELGLKPTDIAIDFLAELDLAQRRLNTSHLDGYDYAAMNEANADKPKRVRPD